jgi:hypothetical protein
MAKHLFKPGVSGNPKGRLPGSKDKRHYNTYLRKEAAAELCQYLKPKLKAIELTSDHENPVQFIMNFGNADTVQRDKNSK